MSSSGKALNDKDVQDIIMAMLSSSVSSENKRYTDNNERNRGGERQGPGTASGYVSERTMDMMLREMRKMDRDRDRVLHAMQVKTLFAKYKVINIMYISEHVNITESSSSHC